MQDIPQQGPVSLSPPARVASTVGGGGGLPSGRNFRHSEESSWSFRMEIAPELWEGGKPPPKEIDILGEQRQGKIESPRE